MVTLRDTEGNELATCVEQPVAGSRKLLMSRVVRGNGNLLKHYFAEGLRYVDVESGGFLLRGMLETSWLGCERQWIVRLTPLTAESTIIVPANESQRTVAG